MITGTPASFGVAFSFCTNSQPFILGMNRSSSTAAGAPCLRMYFSALRPSLLHTDS